MCPPRTPVQNRGSHLPLESFERIAIAKEARDRDEHVLQKRIGLVEVAFEIVEVRRNVGLLGDLHPSLESPQHRAALVRAEVVSRTLEEGRHHFAQRRLGPRDRIGAFRRLGLEADRLRTGQLDPLGVLPQVEQLLRDLGDRKHEVDPVGRHGGYGHRVVFRFGRRLRDRDTAFSLDVRQTERAVATGAGQHHGDRALAMLARQCAEERVDRDGPSALPLERTNDEVAVGHLDLKTRRDHIHVIRFDPHRFRDLRHAHTGAALQDRRRVALVPRRKVQHHDERHARISWHVLEQPGDGRKSSGGGADSHHREGERQRRTLGRVAIGVASERVGHAGLQIGKDRR